MKVILLEDVKALGRRGDVVDVAEGYAQNFLLPKGLAAEASKGALASLDQQKKAQARREAEERAAAEALAKLLESKPVHVTAKAGGNGKLFGAITNAQIAESIAATFDVTLDRHKIELKDAIKALGSYPVSVRLGKNIVAKTTVNVVAG
jgi:large subunit ribosomal protein L9